MNFQEWLKLTEGVSVNVEIPREKRAQRESENMLSLCFELGNHLHQQGHPVVPHSIEPDGESWGDKEGLINFYLSSTGSAGFTKDNIDSVIQAATQYMRGKGMQVGQPIKNTYQDAHDANMQKYGNSNLDTWRDKAGGSLRSLRVVRLPVKMNLEIIQKADMPPNVDMGFDTATAVFDGIFGLGSGGRSPMGDVLKALRGDNDEGEEWKKAGEKEDEDWHGWVFAPDQIIQTYERLTKDGGLEMWAGMGSKPAKELKANDLRSMLGLEPSEDEDEDEDDPKGLKIYQGGPRKDLIVHRAKEVYELAKWAKERGYTKMYAM